MTDPRRLLDDGSGASPALRSLLAAARRADEPGAGQLDALAGRLAPLIAPALPSVPPPSVPGPSVPGTSAPGAAAAGAGHAALVGKLGAVLVALGVIGGGSAWYLHAHHGDPPAVTTTVSDPAARPATSALVAATPDAALAPAPVPSTQPATATVTPVSPPPPSMPAPPHRTSQPAHPPRAPRPAPSATPVPAAIVDDADERALVQAAEAALVHNDASTALSLSQQHGAQFPGGAHAEERDRIAIEALVRLGAGDRARAAAQRFFAQYPRSIYRVRLEGLLREPAQ